MRLRYVKRVSLFHKDNNSEKTKESTKSENKWRTEFILLRALNVTCNDFRVHSVCLKEKENSFKKCLVVVVKKSFTPKIDPQKVDFVLPKLPCRQTKTPKLYSFLVSAGKFHFKIPNPYNYRFISCVTMSLSCFGNISIFKYRFNSCLVIIIQAFLRLRLDCKC